MYTCNLIHYTNIYGMTIYKLTYMLCFDSTQRFEDS